MTPLRVILKNLCSLSVMQILLKILALVLLVAIDRRLGNDVLGQYAFVIAYCLLATLFSDLGVSTYYLRAFARDPSLIPRVTGSLLAVKAALSVVAFLLATILFHAFGKSGLPAAAYYLFFLSFTLMAFGMTFRSVFDSQQRMEHQAILEVVRQALALALSLWMLARGGGLIALAAAHCISSAAYLAFWAIDYFVCYRKMGMGVRPRAWPAMLRNGVPFATFSILNQVQAHIHIILLAIIAGDGPAGYFKKSYAIVFMVYTIPSVLMGTMFPVLSRFAVGNRRNLKIAYGKLLKYLIAIGVPIMLGGWVLSDAIIAALYSADSQSSVLCLRILLLCVVPVLLAAPSNVLLKSIDQERLCWRIILVSSAVAIAADVALIPFYAEYGACWASVLGSAVMFALFTYYGRKHAGTGPVFGKVLPALVAAAIMALVVLLLKDWVNVWLVIVAAAALYGCLLVACRFFSESDKEILRQVVAGRRVGAGLAQGDEMPE